jgi:hypothetical protein
LLEIVLFIFALLLFISDTEQFAIFWTFTTHVIRAAIGLILLKRFPDTHNLIEDLGDSEESTIQDIEAAIIQKYRNILSNNESRLKPVLIAYLIFTIIDILVDNIIFFFLLEKWRDSVYMYENYFSLILIVTFFLCNGVYFSWIGSIKLNFPPIIFSPIKLALFGWFSSLKDRIRIIFSRNSNIN